MSRLEQLRVPLVKRYTQSRARKLLRYRCWRNGDYGVMLMFGSKGGGANQWGCDFVFRSECVLAGEKVRRAGVKKKHCGENL